jgi:hypothetical protein
MKTEDTQCVLLLHTKPLVIYLRAMLQSLVLAYIRVRFIFKKSTFYPNYPQKRTNMLRCNSSSRPKSSATGISNRIVLRLTLLLFTETRNSICEYYCGGYLFIILIQYVFNPICKVQCPYLAAVLAARYGLFAIRDNCSAAGYQLSFEHTVTKYLHRTSRWNRFLNILAIYWDCFMRRKTVILYTFLFICVYIAYLTNLSVAQTTQRPMKG